LTEEAHKSFIAGAEIGWWEKKKSMVGIIEIQNIDFLKLIAYPN